MTKDELFEKVRDYLKSLDVSFEADPEKSTCQVGLDGHNVSVNCILVCSDEPLLIHALSTLPVRVPAEANNRVALGLHELNRRCKLGNLMLDTEERRVTFKISLPFEGVVEVGEVIRLATGLSLFSADEIAPEVMKLIFTSTESRGIEDSPLPARGISPLQAPDGQRPSLN